VASSESILLDTRDGERESSLLHLCQRETMKFYE